MSATQGKTHLSDYCAGPQWWDRSENK